MSNVHMSISDLLPLVAAALNDRAAADAARELAIAKEERDIAQKERDASHRIEILRNNEDDEADEDGEIVVYASAKFEDGRYEYRNPNLWTVVLQQSNHNACRLADIRDCHICVGGGFPVANLEENDHSFQGWIDGELGDSVEIKIHFSPYSTWLSFAIHGWPREEWEAVIQENDLDPDNIVGFLVEDVAAQYPNATVEFREISFVSGKIGGALKRLLTSRRKAEVREERDRRSSQSSQEII